MTRLSSALLLASLAMSVEGFAPSIQAQRQLSTSLASSVPHFIDLSDGSEVEEPKQPRMQQSSKRSKRTTADKHKEGIFSPAVQLGKKLLGDEELNRIRGNAISMHSDAIKKFVSTAESNFGNRVLRALFKLADRNGNGKIEMEELESALNSLGFRWLEEKQLQGIFKRAGGEEKGFLTLEEFMAEAPKTLKTNLVKLAKTNGGELGFLV